VRLDELRKFSDPMVIDKLLEGLQEAGILEMKSTAKNMKGDLLELRYLALVRRWEWFSKEIKKRMSFRELALSWISSGRSAGALADWTLTRRFREYSNLNDWEAEFINKSNTRVFRTQLVAAILIVLLVLGTLATRRGN
jgi:hypothetical protein